MSLKIDNKFVKTIASEIVLDGIGLHTGKTSRVKILPSDSGKIVFRRTDLGIDIEANYKNIVSNHRNSVIGDGEAVVETIEHIMSAFYMYDIYSATVEIDGPEMPIFDGSSKIYIDSFEEVGIKDTNISLDSFTVKKELIYDDGNSYAIIKPSNIYKIDLTIDYKQQLIGKINKNFIVNKEEYLSYYGRAKTFVLLSEILFLIDKGLIKGGSIDSAVVVRDVDIGEKEIKTISNYLNIDASSVVDKLIDHTNYSSRVFGDFRSEICSHKVLDLIGDLALIGKKIAVDIEIIKPGHFANGKIAKLIDENLK